MIRLSWTNISVTSNLVQRGLDMFSRLNVKAYMTLLD